MTDIGIPTSAAIVDDVLLRPDEVARELRASARTVRRWIALGILPAWRVQRHWLVRRRDVLALLAR